MNYKNLSIKMSDKIHELLNDILDKCIPKSKLNSFTELISNYGYDPSSFTYLIEERRS